MTEFLDADDIININSEVLIQGETHKVTNYNDLIFITNIIRCNFTNNIFKQATLLCIAIIAHHPFKEGNHRTSLTASITFLNDNNYDYIGTKEDELKLHKWRFEYEEKNHLEQKWLTMIGDSYSHKNAERNLLEFMKSHYSKKIESYLKSFFKTRSVPL